MLFADLDGVISTHVDDRAFQTDFLGPLFSPPFLASTFEPRRREEDRLIWAAAGSRGLPGSIPTPSTNWVHECHLNIPPVRELYVEARPPDKNLVSRILRKRNDVSLATRTTPVVERANPNCTRSAGKRSSRCWNRLLDQPRLSRPRCPRRQPHPSGHGRGSRGRRPPQARFRG